jgi:hypothetical protein
MGAGLLVPNINDRGLPQTIDGIEYGHVVDTNNAKDMLDVELGKGRRDEICAAE